MDAPEDTPLLTENERVDDPVATEPTSRLRPFKARRWQVQSPKGIVTIVAFIIFSIVTSGMMLLLPIYRLIEDAFCHAYYKDDSLDLIEEKKCKVDGVQSRLVYLMGWLGLLNSIISLIVTFPYGMLADRIGRKPTALLAYGGLALSFVFGPIILSKLQYQVRENPYVLMGGSLWLLLGGGVPVLLATLYAIAADVSSESDKAASFLHLAFGATAGGIVGPLIAGGLMEKFGPWIPIYVVVCITPCIFMLFLVIPETLIVDVKVQKSDCEANLFAAIKKHIANGLYDLGHSAKMLNNPSIPLVLLTFLFQNARFTAYTSILVQYISKHFGWRLAETSFLLSPLGILNLILLASLPSISRLLIERFKFTSFGKDLFLTKLSALILLFGAVVEGFSHNIVIFLIGLFIETFGAAASPLARATVTHYVEPEFTSRLYALIGMVEVLGAFIGGPVLAWCFDQGLKRKGLWIGLPWFYIAFISLLTYIALFFVRPPRRKNVVGDGDGDGHAEDLIGFPASDTSL